jgi:hypothetical protein
MGFVLLTIGLLMVITGARGTYAQFGSQIASEFQGNNSFTYQMIALGSIGALGYIPALQSFSRWVLALILLVILLRGQPGFIQQFNAAMSSGPKAPNATGAATPSPATPTTKTGTAWDMFPSGKDFNDWATSVLSLFGSPGSMFGPPATK